MWVSKFQECITQDARNVLCVLVFGAQIWLQRWSEETGSWVSGSRCGQAEFQASGTVGEKTWWLNSLHHNKTADDWQQ